MDGLITSTHLRLVRKLILKDFIVNLFKKIMEYISKGFSNLIDFLDLEPQVDVDPTVRTDV